MVEDIPRGLYREDDRVPRGHGDREPSHERQISSHGRRSRGIVQLFRRGRRYPGRADEPNRGRDSSPHLRHALWATGGRLFDRGDPRQYPEDIQRFPADRTTGSEDALRTRGPGGIRGLGERGADSGGRVAVGNGDAGLFDEYGPRDQDPQLDYVGVRLREPGTNDL